SRVCCAVMSVRCSIRSISSARCGSLLATYRVFTTATAVRCRLERGQLVGRVSKARSDRLAVAVELVILVVAPLACPEVSEVAHEFDRCNPLHHLEAQLVLAAQPQRCAVQHG